MSTRLRKYNHLILKNDYCCPLVVESIIHEADNWMDASHETIESHYSEPPLFNQTASCGLTPLKVTQVTKPIKQRVTTKNIKSIPTQAPRLRAFENSMSLEQSQNAIGEIASHLDISERAATILARFGLVHTKRYAQ